VALTPQTVEVRFRERDGKQSSKLAAQGTVTRAENVVMSKPGAYARRTGTESLGTVTGAKELTTYGGALVTLSDSELKQRINSAFTTPAASSLQWMSISATKSIETSGDQFAHSHLRAADGRDWHVWEAVEGNSNVIRYSVIEPSTDTRVVDAVSVTSGSRPSIVEVGTDVLIFYVSGAESANTGATADLKVRKIAEASPTSVGAQTDVETTDLSAPADDSFHGPFTYDVISSGGFAWAAYRIIDTGTQKLRIRKWNASSMSSAAVVTEASGQTTNGDDIVAFLENSFSTDFYVAVAYSDGSRNRVVRLSVADSALAGITNHALKTEGTAMPAGVLHGWRNLAGFVSPANGTVHLLAEATNHCTAGTSSSSAFKYTYYITRDTGGSVSSSNRYHLGIASKPWTASGVVYIALQKTSYVQPTYYVAKLQTGDMVGMFFVGSAGAVDNERSAYSSTDLEGQIPNRPGRLPSPSVSGTAATIALLKTRQAPVTHPITGASPDLGRVKRGAWTVTITPWIAGSEFQPVNAADSLLIPGGAPRTFDGSNIDIAGFFAFPEVPSISALSNDLPLVDGARLTALASTTGSLAAGTYFFQIIFERRVAGRLVRSAPSLPFDAVMPGGTGISIRVAPPPRPRLLVDGTDDIVVAVYRTLLDAGEDAPYYRVAEAKLLNDDYVSIAIRDADGTGATSIDNNEQLYTGDGTLDNVPPPPMRQVKVWRDRVMFLLEENRRAFGWSKIIKPDIGLEWSDSFVFEVADEFGDFFGMAPLGNNFVLFKRDAIYWFSGAGPDDTGNGQFSEVIRLDGYPGTTNGRSIVSTEAGVYFQAPDGVIWLLTPSLERTPIGEPCADISLTVVSSIEVPAKRQVRFHTASTTLVYDTIHRVWTTFTGQDALSAASLSGRAHYLSTGAVVRRDDTSYTESGTTYQAVLELSWLSIAGLAGYQRVWSGDVVGEATGAYSLAVVMGADFGNGTSTKTVASSALAAAFGHRVRFYVPMSLQQKTALRLRLQDDSPTTAGGLWEGINLQCGFASGRRPQLPSAHRAT
jgi:hypothetical protein